MILSGEARVCLFKGQNQMLEYFLCNPKQLEKTICNNSQFRLHY